MPVATGPASQARGPTYVYGRSLAGFSKSIVVPRTPQDPQSQAALGKAIRQLREKQGKSQATLANEAGITPNMLSLIERGEANPSWATVSSLAVALTISLAELAKSAEKLD
jgi:DNA-binding XRE family transcriptional regulator